MNLGLLLAYCRHIRRHIGVTSNIPTICRGFSFAVTPPDPRVVPDQKGWKWAKFVGCDDPVAMATFYNVAGNARKLWTLDPSDSKGERTLPRLLLLPMELADWCAEKGADGGGAVHARDGDDDETGGVFDGGRYAIGLGVEHDGSSG